MKSKEVTEKQDAAYEIKFVIPVTVAGAALAWARREWAAGPHANGLDGDGYRVNSLYFAQELGLTPQPVSKYRLSIQAFKLDPKSAHGEVTPANGQSVANLLPAGGQPPDTCAVRSPVEA